MGISTIDTSRFINFSRARYTHAKYVGPGYWAVNITMDLAYSIETVPYGIHTTMGVATHLRSVYPRLHQWSTVKLEPFKNNSPSKQKSWCIRYCYWMKFLQLQRVFQRLWTRIFVKCRERHSFKCSPHTSFKL